MATVERLCVYGMVLTLISLHAEAGLDKAQLCRIRCLHGRGGILCKCSSMHFAGKRALTETSNGGTLAAEPSGSSSPRLPLPGEVALVSPEKTLEDSNFPFSDDELIGSNIFSNRDIVENVLPRLVNDKWGSEKGVQLTDDSEDITSTGLVSNEKPSGALKVSERIILPIIYIDKNSPRRRPAGGDMKRSFSAARQAQRPEMSPIYKSGSHFSNKKSSFHSDERGVASSSSELYPLSTFSNHHAARRPLLSVPAYNRHVQNLQLMISQALEHR